MNSLSRKQHSDYWLTLIIFGLILFGLIMIYSVSKYYSLDITHNATDKYYLKKQLVMLLIGSFAWLFFQGIDYRFWQKYLNYMPFITIFLLLLPILLEPFGLSHTGRWILIGSNQFQPSEIAKLTFLIYLAGWFGKNADNIKKLQSMFWPFMGVIVVIALLMLAQKDMGTLAIFMAIASGIFVVAGAPAGQMIGATGIVGFLAWLAIKIEPYRMSRLLTFLNPNQDGLDAGYHIKNALIAIGSGGLWGLGFGQSKQKYLYLPEAHTDSIFAIICEELGYLRSSLIIIAFCLVAIRGFKIAKNCPDNFGKLLATGITVWLFSQMCINIAAMFSLVPLTGIPLPFISYGGTSLIVLLSAVGILTNISKSKSYAA